MNYIKESEKILKKYRKFNTYLENLEARRKKVIMNGPKELQAIDYSKPNIQKMDYSKDTLNEILEIMEINSEIKETEDEQKIVSNILKQIENENKELKEFLELRYITDHKNSMGKIAEKLGYSENSVKTIYDIKNEALEEFAAYYFGVKALKSI